MRGEYKINSAVQAVQEELPPRARRILYRDYTLVEDSGTTSACAENTCNERVHGHDRVNYLRVRGEYPAHARA